MIDLYYWPTPNGDKITMFLEEAGVDYTIHPAISAPAISSSAIFSPSRRTTACRRLSIPRRRTEANRSACSSQAPSCCTWDLRGRNTATEWLFWQVGGLGPMAGQNHHFGVYAPSRIPYAIERYVKETNRLYGVLDRHLENCTFVAGDDYSIADMASCPWIVPWKRQQQNLDDFSNLRRWFDMVRARPGTQRAYAKGEPYSGRPTVTEEGKNILFGQTANRAPAA